MFDLGVERGHFEIQQSCRSSLVSSGLDQRPLNEINFEAAHFIVKVYTALNVRRMDFANGLDLAQKFESQFSQT